VLQLRGYTSGHGRVLIGSLAALALLLAAGSATPSHPDPGTIRQPERLNLISIVTDDQAAWSVGAYGNRESRTPSMDRLAREGARFVNAFVTTPVCSPSRAGFLTGLYGTQVGITDWISPRQAEDGIGLPPSTTTWPEVLQRNGWRTGLFGKWHLGTQPQFHPSRHGIDRFFGSLAGSFAPMDPELEMNGTLAKRQGAGSDLVMDEALRFVDENRNRPFAALIHFREPHTPYGPMPEADTMPFADLEATLPEWKALDASQVRQWYRGYYASVHAADRNIGRLLAKLDELKLADTTIVMFTSDHGYNIGHHGIHTKGNGWWVAGGVTGPKRPNMFDTSLRVPLIVRWPGTVQPGMEIRESVILLDTFASVLGMLGLPAAGDAAQHGEDFSPLLRGRTIPEWRDTIFGQYDLHNGGLAYMRMIRTPQWKLVRHHFAEGLDELYDLKDDADERRNLYNDEKHRATREALQRRLTGWQRSIDDPILRDARLTR
jgi:arylsulfatase A-like enzyme